MTALSPRVPPRLRAYAHVAQARLRRAGERPPLPRATHFVVTWRCNLQCGTCGVWKRDTSTELDPEQWGRVFAQLRSLDIVKIIGGEPFARDDLGEVVEVVRREVNPFVVQLVTNATMTDEVVRFAERHAWPGLHLRISLDGLEEVHDKSRGHPGAFRKAMETMTALSELRGPRRRFGPGSRRWFQIGVNFILNDDSLEDMTPLVERCDALGVDLIPGFAVRPFLRHSDLSQEVVSTVGVSQPSRMLGRLAREDHGARSGFNGIEQFFLRAANKVVFRKQARGGEALRFRCRELRDLMYLLPNADLITCGLNHEPLGNLATERFDDLWYGERAREFRQRVDDCGGCMQGAVEIMSRIYGG